MFTGSKNFAVSVGLGGSDEFRAGFGSAGALLATLVTARLGVDSYSLFADVMANEVAANPDDTDIDSNRSASCDKGVATCSPTPAATPSWR